MIIVTLLFLLGFPTGVVTTMLALRWYVSRDDGYRWW
jgi:hypothetical protein